MNAEPKTKFAKNTSPFTGEKVRKMQNVDASTLKVCDDPYRPERARTAGKYDAIFDGMKFGQAVRCETKDTAKVSTAMRKWAQERKKKIVVRATKHFDDGMGRVWMLKG